MQINKNILIVGSGRSAIDCTKWDLTNKIVVCINNAWKLLPDRFDYHVCSGDFDIKNMPTVKKSISYTEYSKSIDILSKQLNWKTDYPQHYIGYCIFFQALYWVIEHLKPYKIGTIGCDYDYPEANVIKWLDYNSPNPQNNYNQDKKNKVDAIEWGVSFFSGCEQSHFYGYGTPDPMRLGKEHLIRKFELAKEITQNLGIVVVNYSDVNAINTFLKEKYG